MKLMPDEYPVILRVIIGSQAHGLARPDSDYDYREVFYVPTRELLTLPVRDRPRTAWSDENRHTDDVAGWEVAQFLDMVMTGHPNAVEILFSTIEESTEDGLSLLDLRPHLLCSGKFLSATLGYAKNCRNKLLDHNQEHRQTKWKATYLRILYAGRDFLQTGVFPIRVDDQPWGKIVRAALDNTLSVGEVIDYGDRLETQMKNLTGIVVPAEPNLSAVNEWLLAFRRKHYDQ